MLMLAGVYFQELFVQACQFHKASNGGNAFSGIFSPTKTHP